MEFQINEMKLVELTCQICGSVDYASVARRGQFGIPLNVAICKNCGFSYLNPRWSVEQYHHFYKHEYDKYYRNEINDLTYSPNFKNIKVIEKRAEAAGIFHKNSKFKKILDIGSGMGEGLLYLKGRFKESEFFAVETSERCQKHLSDNNINVIAKTLEELSGYEGSFDFIILRHVLEHFYDPVKALNKVNSLLAANGVIYLAVPDALNPKPPIEGFFFRIVHTSYFNKYTFKLILAKCGLSADGVVEGDESGPNELYSFSKKELKEHTSHPDSSVFKIQLSGYNTSLRRERIASFLRGSIVARVLTFLKKKWKNAAI